MTRPSDQTRTADGTDPAPATPGRAPITAIDVLIVAAAFGTVALRPHLPGNLALVDGLLLVVDILAARHLLSRENIGGATFRRLLPWLGLLLVASVVALRGVGLPWWAVFTLASVVAAPVTFCCVLVLLSGRPATVERARKAMLAGGVLTAVSILVATVIGTAIRQSGATFANANYAAHFLVTCIILLTGAKDVRRWARWSLAILFLAGLAKTASFGGILQLAAAGGYLGWRAGARKLKLDRAPVAGRAVIITSVIVMACGAYLAVSASEFRFGSRLSSKRLNISEDVRLRIWEEALSEVRHHPLGIGPGSYSHVRVPERKQTEPHSDPIAFLVEHGVVGLIAVLVMAGVLWRASGPGGQARVMLVGFGAAAIAHQTFNFRHLWFALAIAMAADLNSRRSEIQASPP